MTPTITFNVCGVSEVPRFAQSSLTDLVSIGTPGSALPDLSAFSVALTIHRFEFDDVSHVCDIGPQKEHAAALIALADSLLARQSDVRVLYHCAAGVSRSTAALFILLVRGGMTYEQAYQSILAVRGILHPNILLIKHADILMGHDGKLLDGVAAFNQGSQDWVKQNGHGF